MPLWGAKLAENMVMRQAVPRNVLMDKPRALNLETPQPRPSNDSYGRPRSNDRPLEVMAIQGLTGDRLIADDPGTHPWATYKTHKEFDDYVAAQAIKVPETWSSLTLAQKGEWLSSN